MGHIPTGTVERRRSLQHGLSPNPYSARPADADRESEDVLNKESARILWEAAWLWIESHIEEYAGKFQDASQDGVRGKNEMWEKVVRLRIESEELDRQLGCISEDVRG